MQKDNLLFFRNALGNTDIEASDIVDTYKEISEEDTFTLEG